MKAKKGRTREDFTSAMEAISNLSQQDLDDAFSAGHFTARSAYNEIELTPTTQRTGPFFRRFLPWRERLVTLLVDRYRRYFKLALAHPHETGGDAPKWARGQLQPVLAVATEAIRDWYMLACDGTNRNVQLIGTMEFVAGERTGLSLLNEPSCSSSTSWRAPAWLFEVSLESVGVGPKSPKQLPMTGSSQYLSAEHTGLLLKGARRVFRRQLKVAIERVRDEEIAAACAIPKGLAPAQNYSTAERKALKHFSKGTSDLTRKHDLSQYMHGLTEKQQLAFSLKYEYEIRPAEIASRMGIDRKTVDEHIEAANRKIDQVRSNERRKANRNKSTPG